MFLIHNIMHLFSVHVLPVHASCQEYTGIHEWYTMVQCYQKIYKIDECLYLRLLTILSFRKLIIHCFVQLYFFLHILWLMYVNIFFLYLFIIIM